MPLRDSKIKKLERNMKKLLFALFAAALPVFAASAADMKIAVIDMGKVFQDYSKTR
jgi:Skp family chaperone for outer membrane proteins